MSGRMEKIMDEMRKDKMKMQKITAKSTPKKATKIKPRSSPTSLSVSLKPGVEKERSNYKRLHETKNIKRLRKVLKSHNKMLRKLTSKEISTEELEDIKKCMESIKKCNEENGSDLLVDIKYVGMQIGKS